MDNFKSNNLSSPRGYSPRNTLFKFFQKMWGDVKLTYKYHHCKNHLRSVAFPILKVRKTPSVDHWLPRGRGNGSLVWCIVNERKFLLRCFCVIFSTVIFFQFFQLTKKIFFNEFYFFRRNSILTLLIFHVGFGH